jgi:hypothetical protein
MQANRPRATAIASPVRPHLLAIDPVRGLGSFVLLAALVLGCSTQARAADETTSAEAPVRAKMMKEKIRASALERIAARDQRRAEQQLRAAQQSDCGSESIGEIATSGPEAPRRDEFTIPPNPGNGAGSGACG